MPWLTWKRDVSRSGVAPISRRQFWELIYALAGQGVTILVTTHYMDEAELCQRIAFISGGKLIARHQHNRYAKMSGQGRIQSDFTDDTAIQ